MAVNMVWEKMKGDTMLHQKQEPCTVNTAEAQETLSPETETLPMEAVDT